jgi:hypothetical protein
MPCPESATRNYGAQLEPTADTQPGLREWWVIMGTGRYPCKPATRTHTPPAALRILSRTSLI